MKTLLSMVIFAVTLALYKACGQGTMIVDQQTQNGDTVGAGPNLFQSFTPSLSSIGYIQLVAYNPGQQGEQQFYVNLLSGSSMGPVIGVTATLNVPEYYVPGTFSTLVFATPVSLIPGDLYFMEPVGVGNFQPLDFLFGSTPYSGGSLTINGTQYPPDDNLIFSEGIIVPEPSVFELVAMGGAAFLIMLRRRARKIEKSLP